ncbi:MAG: MAPEG family protein [Alphaproteobacteria bacterium]|nr:MAPEG family protein [Alphaproteobacteria bacterium]
MNTELAAAAIIAALGLVQILLTAIEYRRVHGIAYANTARDAPPPQPDSVLLGRLSRAQANLMETAPYFIALALIITVAGSSSSMTRIAALIFVAARLLYLPLYAFGTPYVRGLAWTISYGALIALAAGALAAINWAYVLQV